MLLALVAWRAWPLVVISSELNLKGAVIAVMPSEFFTPPARKPDEIRSGMAHPGFDFPKLAVQAIFCPRSMRRGHAFWCNDPALSNAKAEELSQILSDPATYQPWLGEKGCGGFHADWYLCWGSGDDLHEVILCEGCHEALIYYAGGFIRCDLDKKAYEKIVAITATRSES
ncbi:hypothetical protein OJ996_15905 [Luteolibacter sp. GHJ8]|uniref:Uncharacterized protein n=1 Tax=Luteolibacter rhizosphaerae TaxID=2989719 RepID=A0ABT3G5D8_9BACT|nr:hypothetical protein [Luteolibacter rhizosphaerae]MCW1915071.1 hypothetical protein [Luteolibacter rhizosphaerae]